jgi:hypothetical protein
MCWCCKVLISWHKQGTNFPWLIWVSLGYLRVFLMWLHSFRPHSAQLWSIIYQVKPAIYLDIQLGRLGQYSTSQDTFTGRDFSLYHHTQISCGPHLNPVPKRHQGLLPCALNGSGLELNSLWHQVQPVLYWSTLPFLLKELSAQWGRPSLVFSLSADIQLLISISK